MERGSNILPNRPGGQWFQMNAHGQMNAHSHMCAANGAVGSSSDNGLTFHLHQFSAHPPYAMNAATPGSSYSPAPSPTNSSGSHTFAVADADQGRRTSIGRQLIPRSPPRPRHVATLSATTNRNGPSPSGAGPASMIHSIPPRPKPGRKPATEAPETKRKAQNRDAQRTFRKRKEQHGQMLMQENSQLKQQLDEAVNRYLRETQSLRELVGQKDEECRIFVERLGQEQELTRMWRDRCLRMQAGEDVSSLGSRDATPVEQPRHDFHSPLRSARHDAPLQSTQSGCDRCTPEHCACIDDLTHDMRLPDEASAPMDGVSMSGILRGRHGEFDDEKHPHVEHEVDFTNKFRSTATAFAPTMEENKITDCGFCEGQKDICICDPPARVDSADEAISLTRMTSDSSTEELKPNMAMTGPGSCADCQSNPQQRAWCQRVAQLCSEETPSSSRRNSSKSSSLGIMEPKVSTSIDMRAGMASPVGSGRTVGCSDAFKLLDGRVSTDPNAMDWRQLKPVPQTFSRQEARRDTFTMEPGMYSAMELDASSILTTLQHAQRPLRPRPSDGPHAPLIEEAEERRRASFSPTTKAEDHAMADAVSHYNIGP